MGEAPTWLLVLLGCHLSAVGLLVLWLVRDWWQRRNSVLMRGYLYHDKEAGDKLRGKVWYTEAQGADNLQKKGDPPGHFQSAGRALPPSPTVRDDR